MLNPPSSYAGQQQKSLAVSPRAPAWAPIGFALSSAPREVADISLYFLQDEFIKYVLEVRPGGAALINSSKSTTLAEAESVAAEAHATSRDFGIALLEESGFNIGVRLVERYG